MVWLLLLFGERASVAGALCFWELLSLSLLMGSFLLFSYSGGRRRRRRHCCLHTTHILSSLACFRSLLSLRQSSFAEGQLFLIRIYNLLSGSTLYTRRWLLPALCTCSWNNKGFVKNNEAFTGRKSDHYWCCLLPRMREREFWRSLLIFASLLPVTKGEFWNI